MRRTFTVVDIVEILVHWYAGRSKAEIAKSLGVDRKTVRKYVEPAEAAGFVAGGPAVSDETWRANVREWFPSLYDTRLIQPTWKHIAGHHERVKELVGVVPTSVIHQRLVDEVGLEASVASLRRYVRAHFPEEVRRGEVVLWRPALDPGDEAQVDYGYLGTWRDPSTGKARRVWAFSMVLSYSRHLFIYPTLRMDQASWVAAHVAAFEFFQGCPRRIVRQNVPRNIFELLFPSALCGRDDGGAPIAAVKLADGAGGRNITVRAKRAS
jgi:transposase